MWVLLFFFLFQGEELRLKKVYVPRPRAHSWDSNPGPQSPNVSLLTTTPHGLPGRMLRGGTVKGQDLCAGGEEGRRGQGGKEEASRRRGKPVSLTQGVMR